jgi:uncharacterized protein YndB with AHSA1/START domain
LQVDRPVEHAFWVWTAKISLWWPADHTVSAGPGVEVVLEPRVGGRLFERTAGGAVHEWGEVTVFEPPRRLGYRWHLRGDRTDATEVHISFVPDGEAATRIEVEHRGWERLGARGPGAQVLLSGRNQQVVETVATHIAASGGNAQTAVVDPTSPPQVRDYLTAVAGHGPVDVVFNGVGMPGPATGYGIPYAELDPKVLTDAVALVVGSQFLTAREAARLMAPAGRGSIITIASTNGRSGRPHTGGIGGIGVTAGAWSHWPSAWPANTARQAYASTTCAPPE